MTVVNYSENVSRKKYVFDVSNSRLYAVLGLIRVRGLSRL